MNVDTKNSCVLNIDMMLTHPIPIASTLNSCGKSRQFKQCFDPCLDTSIELDLYTLITGVQLDRENRE